MIYAFLFGCLALRETRAIVGDFIDIELFIVIVLFLFLFDKCTYTKLYTHLTLSVVWHSLINIKKTKIIRSPCELIRVCHV